MRWCRAILGLSAAWGCGPKQVPDHLRVDPVEQTVSAQPPTELHTALRQLIDIDPLVRRPAPRSMDWWNRVDGGAPIQAWVETLGPNGTSPTAIDALEAGWPGTVAVPLARGARLAELETTLPTAPPTEDGDRSLLIWLGTFTVRSNPGPSDVRPPLGWLDPDRATARKHLVHIAERAVMLGWLTSPDLPLQPVADAMPEGRYDRLRSRPEGVLILQRSAGATAPDQMDTAYTALHQATALAWTRAAADGVVDQKKAQELGRTMAVALGQPPSTDPLPILLDQAREGFSAHASDATATGLGLVTIAAERISGKCPDAPCVDIGRIATLRQAEAWGADVTPYAHRWRIIAAKDALDQVQSAIDNKRPTYAFPLIADIMVGETGERIPLSLLLQRSLSPEAVLTVTRGLGAPDGTRPEAAVSALMQHVEALCNSAPTNAPGGGPIPLDTICPGAPTRP